MCYPGKENNRANGKVAPASIIFCREVSLAHKKGWCGTFNGIYTNL